MTPELPTSTVGVPELRQNLHDYLRRVDAGETLPVTEQRLAEAARATGVVVYTPR